MTQVNLSKRNLLYLLAELEIGKKMPYIIPVDGPLVVAQSDEDHYKGRTPGAVSPDKLVVMNEIEQRITGVPTFDELTLHEMLDRSLMLAEMFEEHIAQHPAAQHPELQELVTKIECELYDLYQKVGEVRF